MGTTLMILVECDADGCKAHERIQDNGQSMRNLLNLHGWHRIEGGRVICNECKDGYDALVQTITATKSAFFKAREEGVNTTSDAAPSGSGPILGGSINNGLYYGRIPTGEISNDEDRSS